MTDFPISPVYPNPVLTLPVLAEPYKQLSDRLEASVESLLPGLVGQYPLPKPSLYPLAQTSPPNLVLNLPVLIEPLIQLSDRLEASEENLLPGLVGHYPLPKPSLYPLAQTPPPNLVLNLPVLIEPLIQLSDRLEASEENLLPGLVSQYL